MPALLDIFRDTTDHWRWRLVASDFRMLAASARSFPDEKQCLADAESFRDAARDCRVIYNAFENPEVLSAASHLDILVRTKPLAAGSLPRSELIAEFCRRVPPGDFVEVGVFRGGTAAILGSFAREQGRRVHLYDTFQGLPDLAPGDAGALGFQRGQMARSIEAVQSNLKSLGVDLSVFRWHPGLFTEKTPVEAPVALAHLDVDLHDGTLAGLRVIFPRLAPGGVVLVHDYDNPTLPGCARAVDTFEATLAPGSFRAETRAQCRVITRA